MSTGLSFHFLSFQFLFLTYKNLQQFQPVCPFHLFDLTLSSASSSVWISLLKCDTTLELPLHFPSSHIPLPLSLPPPAYGIVSLSLHCQSYYLHLSILLKPTETPACLKTWNLSTKFPAAYCNPLKISPLHYENRATDTRSPSWSSHSTLQTQCLSSL